jgi:hypothetical protein
MKFQIRTASIIADVEAERKFNWYHQQPHQETLFSLCFEADGAWMNYRKRHVLLQ